MAKASAGSVAGLSDVAAVDRATRFTLRVAEICRVSAAAMHRTVDRVKEEVVKKSRIYTIDEILGRNTSVGQFRLVFFSTPFCRPLSRMQMWSRSSLACGRLFFFVFSCLVVDDETKASPSLPPARPVSSSGSTSCDDEEDEPPSPKVRPSYFSTIFRAT